MRRSALIDDDLLAEALDEFDVLHVNRVRRRRTGRPTMTEDYGSSFARWVEDQKDGRATPRRRRP